MPRCCRKWPVHSADQCKSLFVDRRSWLNRQRMHWSKLALTRAKSAPNDLVLLEAKMEETTDINRELMLDANATAGLLYEIFGTEMTASPTECANCGNQ